MVDGMQRDDLVEDPHAIGATISLQELHPRTLKVGDSFAVLDSNGDALPHRNGPEGLFHRDTRHLHHLELIIGNARPLLLSSESGQDGAMLTCDLTNPDLCLPGDVTVARGQIYLRRTVFLTNGKCFVRIGLRSFVNQALTVPLDLRFGADFADLFEVRGEKRQRRGTLHAPVVQTDRVTLSYTGLDGHERATRLRFDPMPARLSSDQASYELQLSAGGSIVLLVELQYSDGAEPDLQPEPVGATFLRALRQSGRVHCAAVARTAAADTSDDVFNEVLRRSASDLRMLVTETSDGPFPYAGVPWYSTVFGRDALITALLTLWMDPAIALGVLRHLAALQATESNAAADAEPGKILHEARNGEMALTGEVPFRRYYGTIDATPLFVMLAGAYLERTGDLNTIGALWPNVERALHWIQTYGDRDGDGLVEYGRRTEEGLANQGWKDSWDSVFHADGELAKPPIALCEVQAYVFAAWRAAAQIAQALGLSEQQVAAYKKQAEQLRERFEAAFWCEDIGTYAIALDGSKRPCKVRSSNAGQVLFCGIAAPERAERIAHQVLGGDFYTGWGIRTLAATEARYNPMSYHDGSVWPHDNALIGIGLARYGRKADAARLLKDLAQAAAVQEFRRLPELFCGFPRRGSQAPIAYPVACAPQAWAAAAPLGLLGACLGLGFDPANHTVRLNQPVLPKGVDRITLRGMSLGGERIDLRIRRAADGAVAMGVLGRTGNITAVMVG